jgi:hypothetical protein
MQHVNDLQICCECASRKIGKRESMETSRIHRNSLGKHIEIIQAIRSVVRIPLTEQSYSVLLY